MKLKLTCVSYVLALLACGETGSRAPIAKTEPRDAEAPIEDASKPIKDAGKDAGMDAAVIDPAAPTVELVQPSAAMDPNSDEVLTSSSIVARCKVTRSTKSGSADINKSAVVITLDQPTDATKKITPPVNALADDEFEATFDVSTLPNGPLHFTCTAKDLATRPHTGATTLDTLLDLGPKIEFFEPKSKGIYTLKTPVAIQFKVTPQKLSETDTEADVKEVVLSAGGIEIPIQESSTSPGSYQTAVDFDDRVLFTVPPTAAEIRVIAKNSRTPDAATRQSRLDVGIDGQGPTIVVNLPNYAEVIRASRILKVTVTDSSGVKPGSLVASFNDGTLIIDTWESGGTPTSFQRSFDTRDPEKFPVDKVTQLTINVTATDMVGNKTTVGHLLRLDNLPPVLSLDPPMVRVYKKPSATSTVCSEAFDALGAATNDFAQIARASLYRVLVEDQTNTVSGAQASYFAGVDTNKVKLYAQYRAETPLLVDTNHDGVCDEVYEPTGKEPVLLNLAALTSRGTGWYTNTTNLHEIGKHDVPKDANGKDVCTADRDSTPAPSGVCPGCDMTIALDSKLEGRQPAIWALNPSNNDGTECEGTTWELASALHDYVGWVCVVARAEDTIGNIGVSAPLRVCLPGPTVDCTNTANAPPCVSTADDETKCTMSPAQYFPPNMIYKQE
jgi:hypothetical protein